jgi:hypothetical protein
MKIAGHDGLLLQFAPDYWTAAERFKKFLGAPFNEAGKTQHALKTIVDHTNKFYVLAYHAATPAA